MIEETTHIQTANYVSIRKTYLDQVVLPTFRHVEATSFKQEYFYTIAGKNVCLRFYSTMLATRLTSALGHLETSRPVHADLTVHLWDAASTGTDFVPPWHEARFMFDQKTDVHALASRRWKGVYLNGEETLSLYDADHETAYFWVRDAVQLPSWIDAAPIRTVLHWFLSTSQVQLVHGACVGRCDKAVLLSAKGGSGKSTTALACVQAGMTYLGDDYVAITSSEPFRAHSLYNSAKALPSSLTHAGLDAEQTDLVGGKAIAFLHETHPNQIRGSASLQAILIPVIAHRDATRIVPTTKAQALLALVPTTLFQLPLADARTMERLTYIIQHTPCYHLEMSEDSNEVAAAIDRFLEAQT